MSGKIAQQASVRVVRPVPSGNMVTMRPMVAMR